MVLNDDYHHVFTEMLSPEMVRFDVRRYPTPKNGPRGRKPTMLIKSLRVIALGKGTPMEEISQWKVWLYGAFARLQDFIKVKYVPFISPQADSLNSGLFSTKDDNKYVGELICGQCVSLTPKDNEIIGLRENQDFFRMVFEEFNYHVADLRRCVSTVLTLIKDHSNLRSLASPLFFGSSQLASVV